MDGPKRKYQINLQNRRKTREILSEYMYNHRILNGFSIKMPLVANHNPQKPSAIIGPIHPDF